jgi:hypothetical protein
MVENIEVKYPAGGERRTLKQGVVKKSRTSDERFFPCSYTKGHKVKVGMKNH